MLRFLKPGLGAAVFGARLLVAFAAPPLAFAAFATSSSAGATGCDTG